MRPVPPALVSNNSTKTESDRSLKTPRTTLKRRAARGQYDRATIDPILDEAFFCHVGFVVGGQPYVLPTAHVRVADELLIHGAAANRMLTTIAQGADVCVTVTLFDGLVVARSIFHHSVNYRSVVLLGRARGVTAHAEKARALDALVEHLIPGRTGDARPPTESEIDQTLVIAIPILEASAKIRSGPPVDDEADLALPYWAGVIPFHWLGQTPIPEPALAANVPLPGYLNRYSQNRRRVDSAR